MRFSLLHGFYWSSFCILYSFLVPLYRHYGFNEVTIGFLSMTGSLASMVIQPLWGLVCDRTGRIKGIFTTMVLLSVLVSYGLWLGRISAGLMFPVIFLLASTFMSMGTVLDSWVMKMGNEGHRVRYSITRGIGSLAFAATSFGFGRLLDAVGMSIIPMAFTFMALLLAGTAALTRAPVHINHDILTGKTTKRPAEHPFFAFSDLAKNPRFMMLLISMMLVFIGTGASIVFMPVRVAELGGANAAVGTAMTVMALSEAAAMLLHHRLAKRFRNELLLAGSLFFFIVKIVVLAMAPSVTLLIVAQVFQFFSFGLYMPSVMHHLNHIVGERQLTTAMLLLASGSSGLGMMVGSSAGGIMASMLGVQSMLLILAGVTACGFLLHLVSSRERISAV